MITIPGRRAVISPIDLWIACTLPSGPAVDSFRGQIGVALADAERVIAEVRAGLGDGAMSAPDRVAAVFGPPTFVRPNRLVYNLALWPHHQFIWAVSRWGDVAAVGLRLRELAPIPPLAAFGVNGARASFRLWYHTEHEVRRAWGKPQEVRGSPPRAWQWVYDASTSPDWCRFGFAWGLLCELAAERKPSRVA
jgi:hypothetical protein